jgi:hypothetical protein
LDVVTLAERIVIPHTVFPAFPYAENYYDIKDTFKASCSAAGFELRDTGEEATTERIIPRILDGIRCAAIVIADVSEPKPNIYYEIGLAQGMKKEVILTARKGTVLPFDVADIPVIFWDNQKTLREQLSHRLHLLLPKQVASM